MSEGMYQQMAQIGDKFYKKLRTDNEECFEKLYSSTASHAELPQFPEYLQKMGEEEVGQWCFKDPSTWPLNSWLVAKWKGFQADLKKELRGFTVVEKLLPMILTVCLAMFAKFAMYDQEKLPQFLEVGKLVTELAIFVVLFKLLKVATILQFVAWKSFGSLSKLEFAMVCQGALLVWSCSVFGMLMVCFWYGYGMFFVCWCIQRHRTKNIVFLCLWMHLHPKAWKNYVFVDAFGCTSIQKAYHNHTKSIPKTDQKQTKTIPKQHPHTPWRTPTLTRSRNLSRRRTARWWQL